MLSTELKKLFERDLEYLGKELDAYPNEESLWIKTEGINNTGGNLFMHLCGNLQHFIGTIMMQNGYVRNRDFEFKGKLLLKELKKELEITKKVVETYFEGVVAVEEKFPLEVFKYPMTVGYFLIHLHGHLNYHTGQINYHRRLLAKGN